MKDDDTLTVVRDSLTTAKDSLTGVHMSTPADVIARAGRARRRRRRLTSLTGATAAAAGTALAITTALAAPGHPASQSGPPAGHPGTARLAAWTVAKQANGDITVTVRQLSDPSGLQSTLRADGVPASVTSVGSPDPSCRPYPMTQALFTSVYQAQKTTGAGTTVLTINPSALPNGAGVQLGAASGTRAEDRGLHRAAVHQTINHAVHQPVHHVAARADNGVLRVGLVSVSQQCTGS
jgi:hypothetical protein